MGRGRKGRAAPAEIASMQPPLCRSRAGGLGRSRAGGLGRSRGTLSPPHREARRHPSPWRPRRRHPRPRGDPSPPRRPPLGSPLPTPPTLPPPPRGEGGRPLPMLRALRSAAAPDAPSPSIRLAIPPPPRTQGEGQPGQNARPGVAAASLPRPPAGWRRAGRGGGGSGAEPSAVCAPRSSARRRRRRRRRRRGAPRQVSALRRPCPGARGGAQPRPGRRLVLPQPRQVEGSLATLPEGAVPGPRPGLEPPCRWPFPRGLQRLRCKSLRGCPASPPLLLCSGVSPPPGPPKEQPSGCQSSRRSAPQPTRGLGAASASPPGRTPGCLPGGELKAARISRLSRRFSSRRNGRSESYRREMC